MEKIKSNKYLILAIIGVTFLIYADFITARRFTISWITIVFGLVPLASQIIITVKKKKTTKH